MTDTQPSRGPDRSKTSVLFVCLGNICRSPLAEGVFRNLVQEPGLEGDFEIDSAGTGAWHVGEPPDRRSASVAAAHGIELDGTARQLEAEDLRDFDYVIAMDRDNLRAIERTRDRASGDAAVHLLREFDPRGGEEVPDPYYGGPGGFENVFQMVRRSCQALLDHLRNTP